MPVVTIGRRIDRVRIVCALGGAVLAIVCPAIANETEAAMTLSPLRVPGALRQVSYYPATRPWDKMWTQWEPSTVGSDLLKIAGLHANTVRVIVQAHVFGYPQVSDTYAQRLRQFIELAADNGLHVQLTLFDWWYEYSDLAGSRAWARQLLQPYAGDPRIAFVELQNEIAVNSTTLAWAREMIPFVRKLLGGETPVSLSVGGKDPLSNLLQLKRGLGRSRLDFYDIHLFGGGGEHATTVLARAKAIAAPQALWVGETGYSTGTTITGFGGVPLTSSAQEAAQGHFLRTLAWATRANSLAPPGLWTFTDFVSTTVPPAGVGKPEIEDHFGVYHADGTPKPSAANLRAIFRKRVSLAFNSGFETSVEDGSGRGVPAVWSMQGDSGVAFASSLTVSRSGARAGQVTADAGGPSGSYAVTPPNCPIARGSRVIAAVWAMRNRTNSNAFLAISWMSPTNRVISRSSSEQLRRVGKWQRLVVSAKVPRSTAYARLELVAQRLEGDVWFDDASWRALRLGSRP